MSSATLSAAHAEAAAFDDFLARETNKGLLRFTTAGSVDDGKSTLIGRLLYDSRSVYDDQLESVTKASVGRNAGTIDFSLLTDGLRAEREQGITIDVAYRYFATPKRKFIIADTPGHEQYTRNMVTGASTADLAIVLVDARKGVLTQSRRHAYIAGLLGIERLVVAVNKMDLVGYDEAVFNRIETDFRNVLKSFPNIQAYFVPVSALAGDNIVTRSQHMPWFQGVPMLEHLETVDVDRRALEWAFRFPVQRVVRPNLDFRGYAGTVVSGSIKPGDAVTIQPSGRKTKIARIVTMDGDLPVAERGAAVTLTLAEEIDLSRGDMIVSAKDAPQKAHAIEAMLVWLNEKPAELTRRYRFKQAARQDWATLKQLEHRVNINTLEREDATTLEMNAIGRVVIETSRLTTFDAYATNRRTGSFILIDAASNATVAAGMILGPAATEDRERLREITALVKDGALIITNETGFDVPIGAEGLRVNDPEALSALRHFLDRVKVAPFDAKQEDWEI